MGQLEGLLLIGRGLERRRKRGGGGGQEKIRGCDSSLDCSCHVKVQQLHSGPPLNVRDFDFIPINSALQEIEVQH